MPADALCWMTVAELAAGIRRGLFSSEEIARALIERIHRLNAAIEPFVTIVADQALAVARDRDSEMRAGHDRGPLHGIPFAAKDVFMTAGIRTTCGSPMLADWVPAEDATAVRRLHDAGAVLVGKTNTHEFAYGVTTQTVFGRTRNPWDPTRLPGGSSGGSASACAAGLIPLALGTDTAGSVRLPAALCGVSGLKPTYGRVSCHGVIPQSFTADHVGPMARTVSDLGRALQAIAGPDARDPTASLVAVPDDLAGLRGPERPVIGVPREFAQGDMQPAVATAFERSMRVFREIGFEVREVQIPLLAQSVEINRTIILAETTAQHDHWAETWFAGRALVYGKDVRDLLDAGRRISGPAFVKASRQRDELRQAIDRALADDCQILLTPAIPFVAPPIDATTVDIGGREVDLLTTAIQFLCAFSLSGHPALVVPCELSPEGLPTAVQLVGRWFDEGGLLAAGLALEEALGLAKRRPSSL